MEPRLRHDFSRVRVHTDAIAAESARAVNALAYTVGEDVVFADSQYAPGQVSSTKLLVHELTHVVQQRNAEKTAVQTKLEVGPADDRLEREADRTADQVVASASATPPEPPSPSPSQAKVQRATSRGPDASPASASTVPAGLIVDDEVRDLSPGQMRKSEFLDQLRAAVCTTADAALVKVGRTAQACPFIEKWIGHLRSRNSAYVERAIRKYTPESAGAKAARDYIAPIGARVQRGVNKWVATGEISDVPPELMSEVPGAGLAGVLGGIGSAISGVVSGIGSALGGLFTKAREGGAQSGNPAAIQEQINGEGSSRPLEGGVQSRMERAFGHNFSHVRVHTDPRAAQLSSDLNARAFTIGNDVAFGAGEYRPGTLVGDALIAHELAHVVQQGGATTSAAPTARGATEYSNLEEDADTSAVEAMVSLWGGAKAGLKTIAGNAMPSLRSGLRLQRCGGAKPSIPTPGKPTVAAPPPVAGPPQPGTETLTKGGETGCDMKTGKVTSEIDPNEHPACMLDCVKAHEDSHVQDQAPKCQELFALYQVAAAAGPKADATKAPADVAAADEAFKKLQEAVSNYETWFCQGWKEREKRAYKAGFEKCQDPPDRCSQDKSTYTKIMNDWKKWMQEPPPSKKCK
jgi:hypothetical protein